MNSISFCLSVRSLASFVSNFAVPISHCMLQQLVGSVIELYMVVGASMAIFLCFLCF